MRAVTVESSADAWTGRDVVFMSYSREDAEWMQAFRVMLEPVLAQRGVRFWADTDIQAGDSWHPEIDRAVARAGSLWYW